MVMMRALQAQGVLGSRWDSAVYLGNVLYTAVMILHPFDSCGAKYTIENGTSEDNQHDNTY